MNISWTNMNIITSILQQQRWAIHVKEDQRKKQVWIQTDPTQQAMKEKFWQSFKTRKERRKCVISRLLKSDQGSSIFMETKERTGRSQLPTNNENWINWMKTSEPWKMPRCCSELCTSNVVQNIIENRDPSGFWYWNVFLWSKSIACSYFAWSWLSYFEVNSGHKM